MPLDEPIEPARRLSELSPKVREMLSGLKPEEVDSLEYLSTIPKEELRGIMKAFRDFKAINRFMRWLILGTVGLFVGAAALGDSISKIIAWFRSPT